MTYELLSAQVFLNLFEEKTARADNSKSLQDLVTILAREMPHWHDPQAYQILAIIFLIQ